MAVINTNTKALFSQNALKITGRLQAKSMEQLSSGKRINTAGDDAAGLAISTRMTQQIRALNQAVRNAGDAISLIQTAEGATAEITNMMQRMRELSIQAINDTNSDPDRSYLDLEFQQLKQEVQRIAEMTEWNGFKVLDGTAGARVGEAPVYKATSINLAGQILIDPTTLRTVTGDDGGEVQTVTFNSANVFQEGQFGIFTILGEQFEVEATGADPTNVTPEEYLTAVVDSLTETSLFAAGTGRSVSMVADDGSGNPYLVFTFDVTDGDVDTIEFNKGDLDILLDSDVVVNDDTMTDWPGRAASTLTAEFFSGDATFIKSGSLTIDLTSASADETEVTATFVSEDNETIQMTGVADRAAGTVTFLRETGNNRQVFSGDLGSTGDTLVYTFQDSDETDLSLVDRAVSVSVSVAGSIPALRAGDLQINGIEVGASYAADDLLSPRNNASGSAIAKAAAINRVAAAQGITVGESQSITLSGVPRTGVIKVAGVDVTITEQEDTAVKAATKIAAALRASHLFSTETGRVVSHASGGSVLNIDFPISEGNVGSIEILPGTTGLVGVVDVIQEFTTSAPGTGVFAKVNENVVTGQAMSAESVVSGVVFINGYASATINTSLNNTRETRQTVVEAINAISFRTGVKAIDTGYDSKGITLVAQDGRNIEVSFETDSNREVFGERIGLRQGVQASTISLESKINNPVVLTSSTLGDINRVGFIEGNFTKNQAVYNSAPRAIVEPPTAQVVGVTVSGDQGEGDGYTVTINGVPVTVAGFDADGNAITTVNGEDISFDSPEGIRDALITAINSTPELVGVVQASAGNIVGELRISAVIAGTPFTYSVSADLDPNGLGGGEIASRLISANRQADYSALGNDDLVINGIEIRPSVAADDTKSDTTAASSDPASSAIAIAAAINSHRHETGVRALANAATTKGLITDTSLPAGSGDMYTLYLNGVAVDVEFTQNEEGYQRREKVVVAINARTGQHGATATDNGEGITLNTDGRNLSAWFDSSIQDLSPASFGLGVDDAVAQVTRVSVKDDLSSGHGITINGVDIYAEGVGDSADTTEDLVAALNDAIDADLSADPRLLANIEVRYSTGNEYFDLVSTVPGSPFTVSGVTTKDPDTGLIDADSSEIVIRTITANDMGSGVVTSILFADELATSAKTAYGTVRLIADAALLPDIPSPVGAPPSDREDMLRASTKPFTVSVGDKGFGIQGKFSDLGFQQGSFGGQSSEAMDPPKVGRLAFQVGASAQQLITIDLADFGKKGSITNEITGDVDLNVEDRSTRINTRPGAEQVLQLLDEAMDKINATRAQMGAVMNRLQYAMDNLSNVSMNQEASRSQIMDADYAKSSTELAKAQIMQQAATAVLAQANMSNQTVLQLLQG
jgi:flagellin